MKYWLMKSEPDVWSIDQQKKAGTKGAPWDGVRNYQAAKNLKSMKKGDLCFFYHSNIGKEIIGIVEVIKEAYLGNPLNEDRKAKEYIKSISDPEERESERKRMFGDDELDEDIQPLAVEKLTDEALLSLLNNIDDDESKFTTAKYELSTSAFDEVKRRGLKIHYVDNERYEFMESVNEDIVDDKAKMYWDQKLKSGEIDTIPDNPRMEYLRHAMRDQLAQDKEQLRRERGLEESINEVVRGDDFRFIEIKDLHFETDPDRLEDMKIEFGEKMGGFTTKDKIEDAEYELRRFRKEIGLVPYL